MSELKPIEQTLQNTPLLKVRFIEFVATKNTILQRNHGYLRTMGFWEGLLRGILALVMKPGPLLACLLSKSWDNLVIGYLNNVYLGGRRIKARLEWSLVKKQQSSLLIIRGR